MLSQPPESSRSIVGSMLLLSPTVGHYETLLIHGLIPGTGLEPVRPCGQEILSLLCLPVPPSRQQSGEGNRTPVHGLKTRCPNR